jgi:hypothetical protein
VLVMARLKPWYQVVTPREDLCEGRPLDASEFAVHLDHIRDRRAHEDYLRPERFFARTFFTGSLLDLCSQVVRRLSGIAVETSAVFNMATQFGGGKTHSLTALYHLAKGGPAARSWQGVDRVLQKAQVAEVPKAAVAVFVGTEFDVLEGRSAEGEPQRLTPWGEIAWQLGGQAAFVAVAEHDKQRVAPGGDVIRKMLPDRPALILLDELLNYASRGRKSGMGDQLFDFIQNLSEEARGRTGLVLCVSIPASELEMNPDDQRDYDSLKKMLDRVGKAMSMSSDTEVTEILRRRLFDWHGLPDDARKTISAYSEWVTDHAAEVATPGGDSPGEVFAACYPFHPSVISVFERKWQSLPRFQRTRGILRLLALWVSRAYREDHQKGAKEPLIGLGSAPLDDQIFRDALFEQLGTDQLSTPVTTDIAGKRDSHAVRLDNASADPIRKARMHQKVATAILFESNGGQSQQKAEASLSEIRTAVGGPDTNLADVETALDALTSNCFYLLWDRNRYRFSLRPNLNQMLVARRGSVAPKDVEERLRNTITNVFKLGPKGVERKYFPEQTSGLLDRPRLTLAVLSLDHPSSELATSTLMESVVRNAGNVSRTFKSGIIFAVSDSGAGVPDAARTVIAWEDIADDEESLSRLDEAQKRSLSESLRRAKKDLEESIWRAYRHVWLLGRDNMLKHIDLGQITSNLAPSLVDLILGQLLHDEDVVEAVSAVRLLRVWPPAIKEWPTNAVRDMFFASPALPRLLDGDTIRQTIADGVQARHFGYARREADGRLVLERFGDALLPHEVELADDTLLVRADQAQRMLEPPRLTVLKVQPAQITVAPGVLTTFTVSGLDQYGHSFPVNDVQWRGPDGVLCDGSFQSGDVTGSFTVTAHAGGLQSQAYIHVMRPEAADRSGEKGSEAGVIRWSGAVPPLKWTQFYNKVLSRLASAESVALTVTLEAKVPEAETAARTGELENALVDLGLTSR